MSVYTLGRVESLLFDNQGPQDITEDANLMSQVSFRHLGKTHNNIVLMVEP